MNITIGTAPDSWGVWFSSDPNQTPWNRFMDEVVEAGYEWIEIGPLGYLPTDKQQLRDELAKRNLKVTGTFVMKDLEDADAWADTKAEALKVGEVITPLNAKYMVLIDGIYSDLFSGKSLRPKRLDEKAFAQLAETTNKVGRLAREQFGLTLVFHPHAETHIEYEDQIEALLAATDPQYVSICLDTGHHAYRGGDPITFMRKHHARIPYLHLKSVDPQKQKEVEEKGIPFALAVADDMFCEPSRGAVNFPAFRDMLNEINYHGWGIVEQDMYPAPFDKPLPIAKRTRAYLREIGLG